MTEEISRAVSLECAPVDAATAPTSMDGIPSTRQKAEEAKQVT